MSDYNWFSEQAVQVATEGLRDEAKKWHALADRMAAVSSLARAQSLQPSAFSVVADGPIGAATTADLHGAYEKMYDWLNSLFRQAIVEFDAMGDALHRNADWYERADADSAQNFDAIARSR